MSQIQGLPSLPNCFSGLIQIQRTVSETSQGDIKEGVSHSLNVLETEQNSENERNSTSELSEDDDFGNENGLSPEVDHTPFSKLNNALQRLKSEMVSL